MRRCTSLTTPGPGATTRLGPLAPWSRPGRVAEVTEAMVAIGFEEIVAFWPWNDEEQAVFEHDAPLVASLS